MIQTEKICSGCKKSKSLDSFYSHPRTKDRKTPRCNECMRLYARTYYALNRESEVARNHRWKTEHGREVFRDRYLKSKYGLSHIEYETLREEQNNKCKICLVEDKETLVVDHDHKTGKVRGLLCHACNRSLGGFKDDPASLRRAADYLEEYE